jgi:hypothetical protein
MKMELDYEKPDISFGEIMYMYEYVNENDYAITQAKPQQAGTDSNVRATVCGGLRRNQPYLSPSGSEQWLVDSGQLSLREKFAAVKWQLSLSCSSCGLRLNIIGLPGDRPRSQRSGTRFPYTGMRMFFFGINSANRSSFMSHFVTSGSKLLSMIKASAAMFCSFTAVSSALAAGVSGKPGFMLGVDGRVEMAFGDRVFCLWTPSTANKNWHFTRSVSAGKGENEKALFKLAAEKEIRGNASIESVSDGKTTRVVWEFSSNEEIEFNALFAGADFPVSEMAGGTWKAGDESGVFPKASDKSHLFTGNVSRLEVSAADGRAFAVSFPVLTHVLIQDNRHWGGNDFSIRLGQAEGVLKKDVLYRLEINVELSEVAEVRRDGEVILAEGADWVPLKASLDIIPGSALDLTKARPDYGRCDSRGRVIVTPDGHFAFSDEPSKPLRFYGANLCFSAQYLPHEKSDILLDRWVQMGYNTLRLHHYEGGLGKEAYKTGFDWSDEKLDWLCYLISGCSKRGIWITTDLFVSRPVSTSQIGVMADAPYSESYDKNRVGMDTYKALVLVHEPAYRDFIEFTDRFLGHVNPYSGKRLADEPAIAWINLINEGAVGDRIKSLPEWKLAWNRWLAKRYDSREALAEALGDLKHNEDPASVTVEFPQSVFYSQSQRSLLCQVFVAETEKAFVERATKHLRENLKCKALLSNHNNGPHTVPDQGMRMIYDYVDDHFYIDHPMFIESPWRLPSRIDNKNPVYEAGGGATAVSRIRIWGKPFTVSEFNFSAPGRYRGVGAIMTGALASIQDWDVLWRFAYSHSDNEMFKPSPIGYFNIASDPLSLAADRAAIMLYLRGDMKPAPGRVVLEISENDVKNGASHDSLQVLRKFAWTTRVGTSIGSAAIPGAITVPLGTTGETLEKKLKTASIMKDGRRSR